jgi:hypothetical protein
MHLLAGLLMSLAGVATALTVGLAPAQRTPKCPLGQAIIRSCLNNNC